MFRQLILVPLLLFQFSCISANSYGASCAGDSNCDQHQKCVASICRCNGNERRFWTGTICAICAKEYNVTIDRCYKTFLELKTWGVARNHCRSQYADLFTWRNNHDVQFILPVIRSWFTAIVFSPQWAQIANTHPSKLYLAWAGATITSLNPHTTKWVDPDGLKLNLQSDQWCDPTQHSGYALPKEPTSGSKKGANGIEREECVTYNFGGSTSSMLCLADDYCSQKYPFICEMNTASMKLASSVNHGTDSDTSSGTGNGDINFEEQEPPPPPSESGAGNENIGSPSALGEKKSMLSKTNIIIFSGVGLLLVVGAIAGYVVIQKKKQGTNDRNGKDGGVSQGRPSFASSIGTIGED